MTKKSNDSVLTPWDSTEPGILQAVAETRSREKEHVIFDQIRRSVIPSSNPAKDKAYQFFEDGNGEESARQLTWTLPGRGEVGKGLWRCGAWIQSKTYGCPAGHEIHAVRNYCHRIRCPVCWAEEVRCKARDVASTLRISRQLHDGFDYRHVIISPPQDYAKSMIGTRDDFNNLKTEVWEVLSNSGSWGCALMFHPFAQNDGTLTWRLHPHFHGIVNGYPDSSRIPKGWILKDKGRIPVQDIYEVAQYILSHVGVPSENMKYVSYFGECSTAGNHSKTKLREYKAKTFLRCSDKDCPVGYQFRYDDYLASKYDGGGVAKPVEVFNTTTVWTLRKDKRAMEELIDGMELDEIIALSKTEPRLFIQFGGFEESEPDNISLGEFDKNKESQEEPQEEKATAEDEDPDLGEGSRSETPPRLGIRHDKIVFSSDGVARIPPLIRQ